MPPIREPGQHRRGDHRLLHVRLANRTVPSALEGAGRKTRLRHFRGRGGRTCPSHCWMMSMHASFQKISRRAGNVHEAIGLSECPV